MQLRSLAKRTCWHTYLEINPSHECNLLGLLDFFFAVALPDFGYLFLLNERDAQHGFPRLANPEAGKLVVSRRMQTLLTV